MVLGTQRDLETSTSIKEIENEMLVSEVMTKNVFALDVEANVVEIADEMTKRNVSSIVITKNNNAVGIITERDIVRKVVAREKEPGKIFAGEIMSSPLITAKPSTNIIDAAKIMLKHDIRRLVIKENSSASGIITDKDLLMIAPGLNTILESLIKMNNEQNILRTPELEKGICEQCGTVGENVMLVNGLMLCESCKDSES
ncbi:MAG: CBS domain-containing protein [Methanosarcinaceae archaeon]|nr:CBS domain-containing protein [Methanosarcinaceae archaeon]